MEASDVKAGMWVVGPAGWDNQIRRGQVVGILEEDDRLVAIDFATSGFNAGHNLDNKLPSNTGWYSYIDSIEPTEAPSGTVPPPASIYKSLREAYPHGHESYIGIALDQIALHSRKNKAYAGGGDTLGNFKRVAAILAQYWPGVFGGDDGPEIVAFIYALKQVDCEAWSMCQGTEDDIEGFTGRTNDQAVYANLRRCMREDKKYA